MINNIFLNNVLHVIVNVKSNFKRFRTVMINQKT